MTFSSRFGTIGGYTRRFFSGEYPLSAIRQLGLLKEIVSSNVRSPQLPYKVTFVATYHCNFRCEMCNIWQKKSVNEMTPDEVELFFERWPQFRWVHLTGGELFMRRDLDELVAAIQKSCKSLFLLNFPTTGWFGDKTVELVENTLERGVGPADGDHQHRRSERDARGDARAARELGPRASRRSAVFAGSGDRISRRSSA